MILLDDWENVDLEPDDHVAYAAAELSKTAQQRISQPSGLRDGYRLIVNSAKLLRMSMLAKNTSITRQSEAMPEMEEAFTQILVRIGLKYAACF